MYIYQVISEKYVTKLGGRGVGRTTKFQNLGTEGQKSCGKISFTDF